MSAELDRLKKTLRKDPRYKRLKQMFTSSSLYKMPFDEYKDELRTLHKTRTIHKQSAGHPNFGHNIIEAAIKDQANRHRYTEILVMCTEAVNNLDKLLESFERYILTEYDADLKRFKTKDERRFFVSSVMHRFHEYKDECEELRQIVKLFIEDIDKAGFTVTNLVKAYDIIMRREPH